MRHTTIGGHRVTPDTVPAAAWIIAAFWILAGIVSMIGVGGGLTRLAIVLAIVTTEWWIVSAVEHRVESVGSRADH